MVHRKSIILAFVVAAAVVATGSPASAEPQPTPNRLSIVDDVDGAAVTFTAGLSRVNTVVVSTPATNTIMFTDTGGITPGAGCVAGATTREALCTIDPNTVLDLDIFLGTKNDMIQFTGALPTSYITLDAGSGNDVVDFGTSTGHWGYVRGGLGNDTLTASPSQTQRLLMDGQEGADYLCGGVDTYADYGDHTSGVGVSMNDVANDGVAGEADNVCSTIKGIKGSTHSDWLIGGPGNNIIDGRSGADVIGGGAGNDTLHGDSGDDYLLGGSGNDVLYGSGGADQMEGQTGLDVCQIDLADTLTDCETVTF